MANRHVIDTTLEGFINVYEDSEKYKTRSFKYRIPADVIQKLEEERLELLEWANSKATGRVQEAFAPWDDEGLIGYSYGEARPYNPIPVFVDTTGEPVEMDVLRDIRKGTKVRLIIQHKPYSMPGKIGTSIKVIGFQIVELVTGNGVMDSGDISVEDVGAMLGTVQGFKVDSPAVRPAAAVAPEDSYDF
jgi:hypothetical protein